MVTVPTIGYEIVSNKPPVTITSIDALGIIEYTEKHKKTLSGLNRNKRYRMLINQNEPICSNNKQKDYTELVKHLYSIRQRRKTIGDYDNYIDDIDRVLKAVGEKMFPDNRDEPTQIISSIHETNYEEEDNKFSDTEMVDLLLDSNIDKEIKYSESESCWYRFDNESNYWVKCPNSSRINNLIKERLRELGIGKINNYHIKNCEQILRGEPRIIVDNFKPKLNLLPLVDKVLDVSEKPVLVLENSPNLYLNYNVGYTYSDSSDCPKTQAYLLESVGGIHEQVETLRAFLNCIVLGRYYLERFLHLDGSGGAGKSTFTRLATALVGEKMTYSTKLKQLEDNKFEVAALRNKKLCLVNDSDKYAGEVSTLKNITGCDSVRFEVKGKQQGEESFTYTGMVIITSNEALRFKDYTSGIKRRKLVIQFHNKPTHCKNLINIVDGNLSGELVPELPHVLRWVLDMQDEQVINYIKYTEQHVPSLVLAQREALIDTNPVADWANERLVYEKGSKAFYGDKSKEGTLYHDFCKYVENSGAYSLGKNNFKGVLKDLLTKQVTGLDVYEIKPQNKPCLVNVRLRTDKDNNLPRLLSFDSVDSMDDVKEVNCLNLFDLPSENSNDIEDIV
jgi:phage/plasmid-associated DNA primase